MKTLVKILCLCLFWFSCDSPTDPESEPEGCDGIPGSGLEFDECGVCGGDNYNSDIYIDEICGECSVYLWSICYDIEITTELSLSNNEFTGGIPSEIGNLTNLNYLYLNSNQLTGEIPSEIGNLVNLERLHLFGNQLTGEIPSEIGNLSNLEFITLGNNQLTGEIPSEIGNLMNLTGLNLGGNQFTGEIPPEIGNLTNLNTLDLDNNQLTGEIPSDIGNLTNLQWLKLQFNQLTGLIPSEICNQGDEDPEVGYNQLCPPYRSCISQDDINTQDTSNCP